MSRREPPQIEPGPEPSPPGDPRDPRLRLGAAILAVVLWLAASAALAPLLGSLDETVAFVILHIVTLGGAAFLVAHLHPGSMFRLLGLRLPGLRIAVGATLIGVSFWMVNAALIGPLSLELFGDEGLAELQQDLLEPDLPVLLLSFGLVPAIFEELLFRGVLARSLETRVSRIGAVSLSAMVFAAIHLPAARMLPALATGLILGYVALTSRSTIAAMWVHLLNNAVVLILTKLAPEAEAAPPDASETIHPAAAIPAVAVLAVGIVLVERARRSEE